MARKDNCLSRKINLNVNKWRCVMDPWSVSRVTKTALYLISPSLVKMSVISQTTFSNTFSWMKIYEFRFKFHWSLFPRVQLPLFQHWFRWWAGTEQATSHCLNHCLPSSPMPLCGTKGRWVNIVNRTPTRTIKRDHTCFTRVCKLMIENLYKYLLTISGFSSFNQVRYSRCMCKIATWLDS